MAELLEKDFINESYRKDPFPFWFWLFFVLILTGLIWTGSLWYDRKLDALIQESPFLQVTNREMSLYLWQNPEFMRANVKTKNGYLPAFDYIDRIGLDADQADEYVIAPPELLFRYHTWDRLVGKDLIALPISKEKFIQFLQDSQEWLPEYWDQAPKEYVKMVSGLPQETHSDLSILSEQELPLIVRRAFQGWQDFFYEGEAIVDLKLTRTEVEAFLAQYPNYARNYWRNIVEDQFPDYLKMEAGEEVPQRELAPFLKVALYNFAQKKNY